MHLHDTKYIIIGLKKCTLIKLYNDKNWLRNVWISIFCEIWLQRAHHIELRWNALPIKFYQNDNFTRYSWAPCLKAFCWHCSMLLLRLRIHIFFFDSITHYFFTSNGIAKTGKSFVMDVYALSSSWDCSCIRVFSLSS